MEESIKKAYDKLFEMMNKATELYGKNFPVGPVIVELQRGNEQIVQIDVIGSSFYNSSTLHNIAHIHDPDDISALTQAVKESVVEKLRKQTIQYGLEHITGKGMHTGITWVRESFNEFCEVMGSDVYHGKDIRFDIDELQENLKHEPWVSAIASKKRYYLTGDDVKKVVNDFIKKYWPGDDITNKDISDVLMVANPLTYRQLVAQEITSGSIHTLPSRELYFISDFLKDIALEPNQARGIHL